MHRDAVVRVELGVPGDTPALRDRLHANGITTYEADVRFAMRYLIDRGLRGSIEITGRSTRARNIGHLFDDPDTLRPCSFRPELKVLSLDIETDPRIRHVLSIGLYGCGTAEVLLLTQRDRSCPEGALPASSEAELLRLMCRRVRGDRPGRHSRLERRRLRLRSAHPKGRSTGSSAGARARLGRDTPTSRPRSPPGDPGAHPRSRRARRARTDPPALSCTWSAWGSTSSPARFSARARR